MKFKNLLKVGFPIVSTSLLAVSLTACSTQTTSSGVDVIHNDGTTASYSSFEDAMNHAISGDYFVLKGDVNLTSPITMKSLNAITIEGAGYTFTFDESANAEAILSFENCTNLTLSGFGVTGGQADSGIKVRNGNVNFYDVVVAGQYKNALYLAGNAGADINDSIFETIGNDKSTEQTIYVSGDTTSVVTLNNVMADSMFIDGENFTKPRVMFKQDVSMRYFVMKQGEGVLNGVSGYKNIKHLWFGGVLITNDGASCGAYGSILPENPHAVFAFNADGLDFFNQFVTAMAGNVNDIQLHLMNDVDYTDHIWNPIATCSKINTDDPHETTAVTLFDGHGHTISNLNINTEYADSNIGFFSVVGDTVTQNVTFDNCRLEIIDYQNAGMLYGKVRGYATLKDVTVSNSYIGAMQKVGTFVGTVDCGIQYYDNEMGTVWDMDDLAKLTISHCTSNNCQVVNKSDKVTPPGGGYPTDDGDIYLGGLVGWLVYHCDQDADDKGAYNSGYMEIDQDSTRPTSVIDIHFNWQLESTDWDTKFEVALLFLYSRGPYRACNSYNNVIVRYSGE